MSLVKLLFKNCTAEELHAGLGPHGVSLRTARRVQAVVIRSGELPGPDSEMPRRELDALRERTDIPRLTLLEKRTSPADGFTKYLFRGDGPEVFEAVRIPLLHRPEDRKHIVCVSSQAGCGLGCAFCATGRLGFQRNLAAWEIVDQALQIRADSDLPVRGIVFMGMGEPFLNYDAVLTAARIFSEPCGLAIASKSITISTVGILPGILRYTRERRPFQLIVSLTSADPARRRSVLPIESRWPAKDLLQALREYAAASRRRVTLAWVMISGFNTREEDAIQLAELTRGLRIKLDLIDVNDPSGQFRPPSKEELGAFRDALTKHVAAPVMRRYSGGADIDAACGLLAGRVAGSTR
jgi:23S rRNA (adenine2503-C2)-methyltransferase